MEQITIKVTDGAVVVYDGKLKNSRLKYYAPGLEIYLKGAVPVRKRDMVNYHAFENCLARHIPLRTLVSYGWN